MGSTDVSSLVKCSGPPCPTIAPRLRLRQLERNHLAHTLPQRIRHWTCPEVGEGLALECVAGRVEKEHRCLLAHLTLEPHMRLDHEARAGLGQAGRERVVERPDSQLPRPGRLPSYQTSAAPSDRSA